MTMRCFIVMGVSGCGKSSVGSGVAAQIGATFTDGDDLHPKANIQKMAAGIPLQDADRYPWLDKVADTLRTAEGPCVIACSALKRKYRDQIRNRVGEPVLFLYLHGSRDVLQKRMSARRGHFMPVSQLDSQLNDLEPPDNSETHITVDIDQPIQAVIQDAVEKIKGVRE